MENVVDVPSRNTMRQQVSVRKRVSGAVLTLLMFFSAYFGSIFLMGPFLWLFFIDLSAFTHIMSELVGSWMDFIMSVFHVLTDMRVHLYGDNLRNNESFVVIMNHRTRLDWIFWWVYLRSRGCLADMKIILKDELNKIPGAGWAMQNAAFLFIKRKWDVDRLSIAKFIRHFARCNRHTKLLLFPEGTDYCPLSKPRSDAYARKACLPRLDYVLHPRTTGFVYIASLLRDADRLDAIYDFTVAYPAGRAMQTVKPSQSDKAVDSNSNLNVENDAIDANHLNAPIPNAEIDVVIGNIPAEVRYYSRRFDVKDLRADDSDWLADWITARWRRKEAFLRRFYREPDQFDADVQIDTDADSARRSVYQSSLSPRLVVIFSLWCVFLVFISYLLAMSPLVRWYFLIMNIVFITISFGFNGMHNLVVEKSCQQLSDVNNHKETTASTTKSD